MRRGLALVIGTGAALLALAPAAHADHHFVQISEVFPGDSKHPTAEFVEIQMYASGQGLLNQTDLTFYNAGGTALVPPLELADVTSDQNQRTLLVGTSAMESLFPVQADVEYGTAVMANAGGGVCLDSETGFGQLDCVAWGTATVSGAGTAEFAIPDGSSIVRDITANCNTLLEGNDDTDVSADDFAPDFPSPQPNSLLGPNSTCPNTTITKKPKAKTTDRTPRFEFSGGDDGFFCSLDGSKAAPCDSGVFKPGKLPRGKHEFEVRASELDGSIDGTPAAYSWKIVKKK